ncbi:MAG: hypothetical protein DRP61_05410 [Candidatus Omnitrophota bacterium]|nr:MAG: hypothetical protein DRP61_05410 [Candidatus Omnitrophota bacterium]
MVKKSISLKDILNLWVSQKKDRNHISIDELYDFLNQNVSLERRAEIMEHLIRCSVCSKKLKELMEAEEKANAMDVVFLKAAATFKPEWPIRVQTEGGKYIVTISPHEEEPERGLITVEVDRYWTRQIEGRPIVVRDGNKRELLRGTVINGKVAGKLDKLSDIELNGIIIEQG